MPLVRVLTVWVREVAGDEAAGWVHYGATSQDILDTAAALVTRDALDAIERDLRSAAELAAELAVEHRATPVAGRTLLQQALPTTFGLKAAGWLSRARRRRRRPGHSLVIAARATRRRGRDVASLGTSGLDVGDVRTAARARRAGTPWHTNRLPLLWAVLPVASRRWLRKVSLDITLLAQTEVGEVTEVAAGRGGSSTMPHKRNPVAAIASRAPRHDTGPGHGAVGRDAAGARAGGWSLACRVATVSASCSSRAVLCVGSPSRCAACRSIRPRCARIWTGPAGSFSPSGSAQRCARRSAACAHDLVEEASKIALADDRPLVDVLLEMPPVTEALGADEVRKLLDPVEYVGSAGAMIDCALARHAAGRPA